MTGKKIEVKTTITEYSSEKELAISDRTLLEQARKVAPNAHAPYSGFYVGAAVLLENGKVVGGNNQENAAYPSGLCAERVAIFAAASQYPGLSMKTIAVTCKSKHEKIHEPLSPCGACRQVMHEYEKLQNGPLRVIMAGESGKVWVVESVNDLLPLAFDGSKLKK